MGCNKLSPDGELSLQRTPYTGNELKINGYYYNISKDYLDQDFFSIYFLFRNGIIRYGGSNTFTLEEYEKKVINSNIVEGKAVWGVFRIDRNIIKYESWYSAPSGKGYPVFIKEGKILNDSTFHITVSYRTDGSDRIEEDELYHFKPFSVKPDSISKWIE